MWMEMMLWKNPSSGIMLLTGLPLFRRYTRSHCWALVAGPFTSLEWDPPIRRGSVVWLRPRGQICAMADLPPISANQERLSLSALWWRHIKNVKLWRYNVARASARLQEATNEYQKLDWAKKYLPDLLMTVTLSDTPNNGLDFVEELT